MFNKLIYAIVCFAFVLYLHDPTFSVLILTGLFFWIWVKLKMNGGDLLVGPIKPSETPLLWVTRSRKISLVKAFDKAEGYLALPKWGTIRVAPNSDYWFAGKKAMIGVEGITHTVRLEDVKLTEKLAAKGFKSLDEAKAAYGIESEEKAHGAVRTPT